MAPGAPPPIAKRLGLLGLIPFVVLAVLLWIVHFDLQAWLAIVLAAYGTLIASFLGGNHWGVAQKIHDVSEQATISQVRFHYIWGITPCLLAWLAAVIPAYAGLPLLGLILLACYLVDRRTYPRAGMSLWLPMRLQLTVVAVVSCLVSAAAI